ncbi:MAG TPA: hypothetical protein PLM49_02915 [Bacteroidales bacterium]|nr:hypothetical protein [Bacteroidales bacterium]
MGISMFKLPGYSVFTYKPRYYDPIKDKREKRRRDLRLAAGKEPFDDGKPGSSIKGSFAYMIERRTSHQKMSRIRFLIILVSLVLLAYLILVADFSKLINWLNQ